MNVVELGIKELEKTRCGEITPAQLLFITLLCIFAAISIFYVITTEDHYIPVPKNKFEMGLCTFWACMDGCSNMQELLFDFDYYNVSMKNLHDSCAAICAHQYWPHSNT